MPDGRVGWFFNLLGSSTGLPKSSIGLLLVALIDGFADVVVVAEAGVCFDAVKSFCLLEDLGVEDTGSNNNFLIKY